MIRSIVLSLFLLFSGVSFTKAQNVEEAEAPLEEVHYDDAVEAIPDGEEMDEMEYEFGETESYSDENVFPEALKTHPFIRYQEKINNPDEAEAYPWISADGLRLFFIKGNTIYKSERTSRYDDFASDHVLEIEDNNSITSCWLTNDELHLYTTSSIIKHYSRSSIQDQFVYIGNLDIDDKVSGFFSSISFTPDMKTALIYNSPSSESKSLVIFDVTNQGTLKLRDRFVSLNGTSGVGQLSKDGKSVYYTNEVSTYHKIICKASLLEIEQGAPRVENILELKGVRIGKPSLTYDETYMVFNATANDRWQDNEIMVVDLNNLSYIPQDPEVFVMGEETTAPRGLEINEKVLRKPMAQSPSNSNVVRSAGAEDFALRVLKIYPNPTKGKVVIEHQIPVNAEIAQLIVNDMRGREIFRKKIDINSLQSEVNLKELGVVEGQYLFFLHTELGTSESKKIFFQAEN